MAFELQNDVVRPEVQRNTATTVSIYPTLDGLRVRGGSTAEWKVFDRGTTGYGAGTVSETAVALGSTMVSRYDLPIPAIDKLDEDYRVEVVWTDATGQQRWEIVMFDVVLAPLGQSISFSDLLEEHQSVERMLVTYGERLGVAVSETDETKRNKAMQVLAKKARTQLIAWLRQQGEKPRPYMILDRYAINPVERLIAMRDLFRSLAKQPEDGEEQNDDSYRHYRALAWETFSQLRITFAGDDALTPDRETLGFRSVSARRVQTV